VNRHWSRTRGQSHGGSLYSVESFLQTQAL
jgi:hypothetical protein